MEAATRRRVRSGKEYDRLFPRPTGNDSVIKKGAEVNDTVKFIRDKVPKTTWHTEKIARKLKGRTLDETCSTIWHFVYEHIPYKRDEQGIEQVRSPRRAWHDRDVAGRDGKVGVDCDCYTVFISSILMNLHIPHKYRITMYPKDNGETPTWQHIYVVIPKDGKLNYDLDNRDDYIVIDCVKNNYDDEEPYLKFKDFDANMRLDYLDGIDDGEEYIVPETIDIQDIASVYDEEELGKIGQWLKKTVKKVGKAAGKVVRTLNRFTNPGTILLRNGFLLAMKVNFLNVAKRLRYAYLTDSQAQAMGMNMSAFAKLKNVKDKAEKIYYTAGGKKENFKAAILKGKGNKDKKVPLSGFSGFGEVYADQDEYDIIHSVNGLGELGDPATGTALAAAISTVTAIAGALSQVKGLFKPGSKEESSMASSEDTEAQAAVTQVSPESLMYEQEEFEISPTLPAIVPRTAMQINPGMSTELVTQPGTDVQTTSSGELKLGFFQNAFKKTGDWVKGNPVLTAGIVLGAGYLVYRGVNKKSTSGGGLSGIPRKSKRRRIKKTKSKSKRKVTLKPIRIK